MLTAPVAIAGPVHQINATGPTLPKQAGGRREDLRGSRLHRAPEDPEAIVVMTKLCGRRVPKTREAVVVMTKRCGRRGPKIAESNQDNVDPRKRSRSISPRSRKESSAWSRTRRKLRRDTRSLRPNTGP